MTVNSSAVQGDAHLFCCAYIGENIQEKVFFFFFDSALSERLKFKVEVWNCSFYQEQTGQHVYHAGMWHVINVCLLFWFVF